MDTIISPVNIEERKNLDVRAGDTVRVHQKIEEKGKTRLQVFEGLVLARKHGREAGATFTVRRVIDGVGVEKIFPLYSPNIDKIEITRRAKMRRAKLYHIRDIASKEVKRQMRKMQMMDISVGGEEETVKPEDKKTEEPQEEAPKVAEVKKEVEKTEKVEEAKKEEK